MILSRGVHDTYLQPSKVEKLKNFFRSVQLNMKMIFSLFTPLDMEKRSSTHNLIFYHFASSSL